MSKNKLPALDSEEKLSDVEGAVLKTKTATALGNFIIAFGDMETKVMSAVIWVLCGDKPLYKHESCVTYLLKNSEFETIKNTLKHLVKEFLRDGNEKNDWLSFIKDIERLQTFRNVLAHGNAIYTNGKITKQSKKGYKSYSVTEIEKELEVLKNRLQQISFSMIMPHHTIGDSWKNLCKLPRLLWKNEKNWEELDIDIIDGPIYYTGAGIIDYSADIEEENDPNVQR